jgi:single-strand DNA-binding protein
MATFNRVMLIGNLTRDPEVKTIPSGMNVADLRLAVNDDYKDKNGQEVKRVCYVDVTVWDKQAETCKKYLSKGSTICVEGRLKMDEWTTTEGQKRSKLRVSAERVQFLGVPKGAGGGGARGATSGNEAPLPSEDLEEAMPDGEGF